MVGLATPLNKFLLLKLHSAECIESAVQNFLSPKAGRFIGCKMLAFDVKLYGGKIPNTLAIRSGCSRLLALPSAPGHGEPIQVEISSRRGISFSLHTFATIVV